MATVREPAPVRDIPEGTAYGRPPQHPDPALTQVGPGTPMGELMRRYWYPVAFERELDEWPIKKVRLLGENFAMWKKPKGGYGIMQEHCPHRRASMVYGVVEEEGLRCGYHGWLFDGTGQCLDQPAEPEESTFAGRVGSMSGTTVVTCIAALNRANNGKPGRSISPG